MSHACWCHALRPPKEPSFIHTQVLFEGGDIYRSYGNLPPNLADHHFDSQFEWKALYYLLRYMLTCADDGMQLVCLLIRARNM